MTVKISYNERVDLLHNQFQEFHVKTKYFTNIIVSQKRFITET